MRLPRNVSGKVLIKSLKSLGYEIPDKREATFA